jgi:hypothetical protein
MPGAVTSGDKGSLRDEQEDPLGKNAAVNGNDPTR